MTIEQRTAIYRALGHPTRLRITDALRDGERCVCELVAISGLCWSSVSRHLSVLKKAGIVSDEKRGLQVFYRICLPCVLDLCDCLAETGGHSCACSEDAPCGRPDVD